MQTETHYLIHLLIYRDIHDMDFANSQAKELTNELSYLHQATPLSSDYKNSNKWSQTRLL